VTTATNAVPGLASSAGGVGIVEPVGTAKTVDDGIVDQCLANLEGAAGQCLQNIGGKYEISEYGRSICSGFGFGAGCCNTDVCSNVAGV
jgi:hypothetical protein